MKKNGWKDRAEIIVFEPELEIWVWVNSPHFASSVGWSDMNEIKKYLMNQGLWEHGTRKPKRPKEAFEALLKEKKIPRSSSIYQKIANRVNFRDCEDHAFIKFKLLMQKWFPQTSKAGES